MVRISVPLPETTWKDLRRMAEGRRVGGRASVSALIVQMIEAALAASPGAD